MRSYIALFFIGLISSGIIIDGIPLVRSEDNDKGCDATEMIELAQEYLWTQPFSPGNWTKFVNRLSPNIVMTTNVQNVPDAIGITQANATLHGINTLYQRIYNITVLPTYFTKHNGVMCHFSKVQGSLRMQLPYDITFQHYLEFEKINGKCYVKKIAEFADTWKTEQSLALELGGLSAAVCDRIKYVCANFLPNFGNPTNNCDQHWINAPRIIQNNTAPLDDLTLISPSFSLSCVQSTLSIIQNNPGFDAFLCQNVGIPVPGVAGCWNQTSV